MQKSSTHRIQNECGKFKAVDVRQTHALCCNVRSPIRFDSLIRLKTTEANSVAFSVVVNDSLEHYS